MNLKVNIIKILNESIEHIVNIDEETSNKIKKIINIISTGNIADYYVLNYENYILNIFYAIHHRETEYLNCNKYKIKAWKNIRILIIWIEKIKNVFEEYRSESGLLNESQTNFFIENDVSLNIIKILMKNESKFIRNSWIRKYMQGVPDFVYYGKTKCSARHMCSNCNPLRDQEGFHWHAFNGNYFPIKRVKSNYLSSINIIESHLIFMWEFCLALLVEVPTEIAKKIDFSKHNDLYIYPKSIQWTFVCTHEGGYIVAD